MIRLELPWPPTVNNYYRVIDERPHPVISKRGREYRKAIDGEVRRILGSPEPLREEVGIRIDFHPPSKAKRDMDNHIKALLDALTKAGVWMDDSQIKEAHLYWGEKVKHGSVIIEIWERT